MIGAVVRAMNRGFHMHQGTGLYGPGNVVRCAATVSICFEVATLPFCSTLLLLLHRQNHHLPFLKMGFCGPEGIGRAHWILINIDFLFQKFYFVCSHRRYVLVLHVPLTILFFRNSISQDRKTLPGAPKLLVIKFLTLKTLFHCRLGNAGYTEVNFHTSSPKD